MLNRCSFQGSRLILLLAAAALSLHASPIAHACNCDPNLESFNQQLTLGADLSDVGLNLLDPSGRTLQLQERVIRARRARLLAQGDVPPECQQAAALQRDKLDRLDVGTTLYLGFSSPDGDSSTLLTPVSNYRNLLSIAEQTYVSFGRSKCSRTDLGCLREKAGENLDTYAELQEEIPLESRENLYRYSAKVLRPNGELSAEELHALESFTSLMTTQGHEAFRARTQALAGTLSEPEKILLLSMMGDMMLQGYDDRRKENILDGSVVSTEAIFSNVQANFSRRRADFPESERGPLTSTAGVCRDIAVAQAVLARDLGLKKAVTVTFATEASHHTTLVVQSKSGDGKDIFLVDYDQITRRRSTDGSRLIRHTQDPYFRDHAVNYRLHDADGRPLGRVTSAKGKFLLEAAGFDARTYDPLASPRNDIIATSLVLGGAKQTAVRAVAGRDENDVKYLGLAADTQWGREDRMGPSEGWEQGGKTGMFAGVQLPNGETQTEFKPSHTDIAFVQLTESLYTPVYEPVSGLKLSAEAQVTGTGELHREFGSVSSKTHLRLPRGVSVDFAQTESGYLNTGVDGDTQGKVGGTAEYTFEDTGTTASVSADLRVSPEAKEVRASPGNLSSWRIIPLGMDLSTAVHQKLGSGWTAHGRFDTSIDRMGSRGLATLGASGQDLGVEAGWSGRMTSENGIPDLIQDNSLQRARLNTRYRLMDGMDLGGSVESNFENLTQGGIYLEGTFW